MAELFETINAFVWGPVMLACMLGTGIYLHLRMRFLPLCNLGYALRLLWKPEKRTGTEQTVRKRGQEGISPLSALATELAATVGTGNIVGVATAMVLGGPGALLWMLLAAFIGLSTKFAESMLAVHYRIRKKDGSYVGGPMYTMALGIHGSDGTHGCLTGRLLGGLYGLLAVLVSFGMGNMAQANAIAASFRESFDIPPEQTGLILTVLVILTVLGGIRWIAGLSLYLVPGMALFYILGALVVILFHLPGLGRGLAEMLGLAGSWQAAAGGLGGMLAAIRGHTAWEAMRWGISRGVFSNEAGLGAAGITAAAADTDSPVRQGYLSMTGVFFDTILLCTLTGLAIAASGLLGTKSPEGTLLTGTGLTNAVFATVFGRLGSCFVSIAIALFAFATIIAWEYQGECAFCFLTGGEGQSLPYRLLYGLLTFVGAVCPMGLVWDFADCMNGLLAVPNLFSLWLLAEVPVREIRAYEKQRTV